MHRAIIATGEGGRDGDDARLRVISAAARGKGKTRIVTDYAVRLAHNRRRNCISPLMDAENRFLSPPPVNQQLDAGRVRLRRATFENPEPRVRVWPA